MNQNMLHVCSSFIVQKEAYFLIRWNVNVNDADFSLIENQTLSNMGIARMPTHDEPCNQCKNNKLKWQCLDNFLFELLPLICEIFF